MNTNANHRSDAFTKRLRRHVTGRNRAYFAVTAPGFEKACRQELVAMVPDAGNVAVEAGGVAFTGRLVDGLRANLHLRTATRILMRIDAFGATNPRQLEKKAAAIAWELFLPPGPSPVVKVSSHRSRLYHSDAITQAVLAGIAARMTDASPLPPADTPQTLFVRILKDHVTLSLDSSGEPLFKRGLKSGPARAPIRETLAAGILIAAGYDPARPLVDPMCGSGTFALEAAMLAKRVAPGGYRQFAFMAWPAYADNQWAFLKREAGERIRTFRHPLVFSSDIDDTACQRLTRSVAENDLADAAVVSQKDLFACRADDYGGGPGLVTINPPYGIRIGSTGQAVQLFRAICRHLAKAFKGWRVAIIVPRIDLCQHLPFAATTMPLSHGGLKLTLAIGDIGV